MQIEDYDQVFRLWEATPGMGLRSLDDTPEGISRFLARNPSTCFVAEDNDGVVGAILSGHDGRRGYIYHAAVATSRRRSGIGRALVKSVINAMKDESINKLALVAFKDNDSGNRFWESMGFTQRNDLEYRNKSINDDNH